jgi:hypothetical protein
MTRFGTITPMTRNGLQNSTDSVCRTLFEDVLENIKRGGVHAQRDPLQGVPESIIMGNEAPIGTGATDVEPSRAPPPQPPQNHTQPQGYAELQRDRNEKSKGALSDLPTTINSADSVDIDHEGRDDLRVRCAVREVPCRPRPFRFFQQFVPVTRSGRIDPAHGQLVPPPAIATSAPPLASPAVGKQKQQPGFEDASSGPTGARALGLAPQQVVFHYARRPVWRARAPILDDIALTAEGAPKLQRDATSWWWRCRAVAAWDVDIELAPDGHCLVSAAA